MKAPDKSDRRDSYRLDLEPGRARIVVNGVQIDVRDLSASGSSLILREGAQLDEDCLTAVFEGEEGESFRTELRIVRRVGHREGTIAVGAQFGPLEAQALYQLSSLFNREFNRRSSSVSRLLAETQSVRITNPAIISNLFSPQSTGGERFLSLISDDLVHRPLQLRIEGQMFDQGRRAIYARFVGDPGCIAPGRLYTFVLSGGGAATVFETVCLGQHGMGVLLAHPGEVRQTGFRESPRVTVSAGSNLALEYIHPRLSGAPFRVPILDLAGRGIAFKVDSKKHALFPGDRLERFRVVLPDGVVEAQGIIRAISGRPGQDQVSCGVELLAFAGSRDSAEWRKFFFSRLHPNLSDGNQEPDAAWEVLEGSDYLRLWTPDEERTRLRRQFMGAWAEPAVQAGQTLLLKKSGRSVGLSAGSLVYPRTWMLHHLGIERAAERGANEPLHQTYELISGILHRLQEAPEIDYFLIYAEQGKRLNDRLYRDFARHYFGASKLLLTSTHLYRYSTDVSSELNSKSSRLSVAQADDAVWSMLAEYLERETPPIEREALALGADRIDLRDFTHQCREWDYERERKAYIAYVDGVPHAALIADSGDEGVNVFGLMNTCRIVWMADPVPGVQSQLIDLAVVHYRGLGKRHFFVFADAQNGELSLDGTGFESVFPAIRWLAHRDVIPSWVAYVEGLLRSSEGGMRPVCRSVGEEPRLVAQ